MSKIIGRTEEQKVLEKIFKSAESEFVAIYGRRRVGKTYLINNYFSTKDCMFLQVTGLKDGLIQEQITNFTKALEEVFYNEKVQLKTAENWNKAFDLLTNIIKQQPNKKRIVIFLDELPWLATKKSHFLQNLDYFWNHYWSKMGNIKLIVCGSAASWMINNLLRNKGGLHNRVTARIVLSPFNLSETKKFLKARGFTYTNQQILDLYMVTGGIPYYLKLLDNKRSVTSNIDYLCFGSKGSLVDEFNELYSSLFADHEAYEELIRIIAAKRQGTERTKILEKAKLSSDGGTFKLRLKALEEAGFIVSFKPYGNKTRGTYYRIIDEYTLFYLFWIEPVYLNIQKMARRQGYWQEQSLSPEWTSWAGYAFEAICYKHITNIRKALDISVTAKSGNWQFIPSKGSKENGAQIDLLFDRKDKVITICEIKFTNEPFKIDKQYALNLLNKTKIFQQKTKTNKQIVTAIISANGVKQTAYSEELISAVVTSSDLFKD
jgi:uncharacterized protein